MKDYADKSWLDIGKPRESFAKFIIEAVAFVIVIIFTLSIISWVGGHI